MTDTRYTYASGAASALQNARLTTEAISRIANAKSESDILDALEDTFLAPLLSERSYAAADAAIMLAIDETMITLRSLDTIGVLSKILTLKFDAQNCKVILRSIKRQLDPETIFSQCSKSGSISPQQLLMLLNDQAQASQRPMIESIVAQRSKMTSAREIDHRVDRAYFHELNRITNQGDDQIIHQLIVLTIDIFNLQTALRLSVQSGLEEFKPIDGGRLKPKDFSDRDIVMMNIAARIPKSDLGDKMIIFEQTAETFPLEQLLEAQITSYAKQASLQFFSAGPLLFYILCRLEDLQKLRELLIAHRSELNNYLARL